MQTVGEILRSEREKRGMTVKDIEAATHIRALYISAIEDGHYHVLPGEVYLKGFIRNYANLLGLDSVALLTLYKEGLQPPAPAPEPGLSREAPQNKAMQDSQEENEPAITPAERRKEARRQQNRASLPARWLTFVVVVAVLAGAGWWYTSTTNNPTTPSPQMNQPTTPSQPSLPQQLAPAAPVQPAVKTKPIVVVTKITGECWATVVVDGKEVFEGFFSSGQSRTWEGDTSIVFSLGNAGAVEFTHNGRNVGKIGGMGEVVPNYKFTK